jgi:molecular chaperone Hsp33
MADQLIRGTAANGKIRVVGVVSTKAVEEARVRHQASFVATAALGRTMTASLLLAANLKLDTARINIRIDGDGPLGGILADAGADGTVRGYLSDPTVELSLNDQGKLDVGTAVGKGYLHVLKDLGYGYPYAGTVELVTGEIGDDITEYLSVSEQTSSVVLLGVYVTPEGVDAAGGILIQFMPGEEDTELERVLNQNLAGVTGITNYLRAGKKLPDILEEILLGLELQLAQEVQMVRFQCGCTVDRVRGALKMLGSDELKDMIEKDGGAEATCHFCNEIYQLSGQDLDDLVQELSDQRSKG